MMLKTMEVRSTFLHGRPDDILGVLKKQKYQKIMVVLDTLCENYKTILYEVRKILIN